MPEVKYIDLSQQLEHDLRAGRFGEWLPNIRELAGLFGVAKSTMSRALHPLAARGLIAPGPGGTRVTELARRNGEARIVAVVLDQDESTMQQDTMLSALKEAARCDHTELIFLRSTGPAIFSRFHFWDASFCDGFIFVYSTFYQMLLTHLKIQSVPFLIANPLPGAIKVKWIDFDVRRNIFDLVLALAEHGFRRPAYFWGTSWRHVAELQFDLWQDVCSSFEFYNYTAQSEWFMEMPEAFFDHCLAAPAAPPDVIINVNQDGQAFVDALDRRHLPGRVVAGADYLHETVSPRIIRHGGGDWKMFGTAVWRRFMEIRDGHAGSADGRLVPYALQLDFGSEAQDIQVAPPPKK